MPEYIYLKAENSGQQKWWLSLVSTVHPPSVYLLQLPHPFFLKQFMLQKCLAIYLTLYIPMGY